MPDRGSDDTGDASADSRIGWLLEASRRYHPEAPPRTSFARGLAAAGVSASPAQLRRWESGSDRVPLEVVEAYERLLGLDSGRLTVLAARLRDDDDDVAARPARPPLRPAPGQAGELAALAARGLATAAQWYELAHLLASGGAGPDAVVDVGKETWRGLCRELVSALARSVRLSYVRVNAAATELSRLEGVGDLLVEAVEDYLKDPDAQVTSNPFALLDRIATRRAAAVVLDAVDSEDSRVDFGVAVWAAAVKAERGDFTAAERSRLYLTVLRRWRSDRYAAAGQLSELIATLPPSLRTMLAQATQEAGRPELGLRLRHGEAPSAAVAGLGHRVAAGALARRTSGARAADPRLRTIATEALLHRDSDRRYFANLTMACSGLGPAVAEELLALLEGEPDLPPWARARVAVSVRFLCEDGHRTRIARLLRDPDEAVAVATRQGLGHLAHHPVSDQELRRSLTAEASPRSRATMYALGMTGSPALVTITRSPAAPAWQRSAAAWWRRIGSAVRD